MAYTRPLADIRVGGEIDGMCTKCRRLTNHRIVAMVDGGVKRVICLTCDSQHNYRKASGEKRNGDSQVRRVSSALKKTSNPGGNGRIYAQWLSSSSELTSSGVPPLVYSFKETYEQGQALVHFKFGLGFVQKIIPPNKMEIMFENEIKTLAMNTEV